MKLSTCSARAATREGTVKNAAIKIIKRKAQANYSPAPGARTAAGEQVIVIIKLEDRGGGGGSGCSARPGRGRVHMPDCFRGQVETCWDTANGNMSDSAESTQKTSGPPPVGHGSRTHVELSRCKLSTTPGALANVTRCPLVNYSIDG